MLQESSGNISFAIGALKVPFWPRAVRPQLLKTFQLETQVQLPYFVRIQTDLPPS